MYFGQHLTRAAAALFGVATLLVAAPRAAAQLRIVTYNTATGQYDNPLNGQTARPGTDLVLQSIGAESVGGVAKPIDVLLLQEQFHLNTTTQSFVDVLNGIYGAGVYARSLVEGNASHPDDEAGRPALVYNTQTVELIGELAFGTVSGSAQPRSTLRYALKPVGYDDSAIFLAYNSHYKADTGTANEARRLIEANSIRNNADSFGEGLPIIYAGDFNIQAAGDDMYQRLLEDGPGQAFDPVGASGTPATPVTWHNSSTYRHLHTQAPSIDRRFDGQSSNPGGMDDRFDFQLVSGELLDGEGLSYIEGSYRAFGNNGSHFCCNSPITAGDGAAPDVLNALMSVSDHLPVVADYQLPAIMDVQFGSFPAHVSSGASAPIDVFVENVAAGLTASSVDELDYTITVFGDLIGGLSDVDLPFGGGNAHQVFLDTSAPGLRSGLITVQATSQAAANPVATFPVAFSVGDAPIAADFNEDGVVDEVDLAAWHGGFGTGQGALKAQGDADGDGDVDGRDFIVWQELLGLGRSTAVAENVAVGEPNALGLACLVAAALVARGRQS